jgi:hypothetical protein
VAFGMSVAGIAFGLSSPRVQGPARDIHVLLVPLAAIVFGLLIWLRQKRRGLRGETPAPDSRNGGTVPAEDGARDHKRPIAILIGALMALATGTFIVVSVIHFGVVIALGPVTIDDPFPGAAIPEAVIAAVLGIGSLAMITQWLSRWRVALGTSLFALLFTIYGLTVTLGSSRVGDVAYHITILVVLAVIVGLLLAPAGRGALGLTPDGSMGRNVAKG